MTSAPRNFVPLQRPANPDPAHREPVTQRAAARWEGNVGQASPGAVRRAVYRERDIGVGYGNSSGYASDRRYARDWAGQPRFRCG